MNHYEAKQEAKRLRLLERARRLRTLAKGLENRNREMLDVMAGTPVLIGHHSEKRHRRDLDRIRRAFTKAADAEEQARSLEQRARSVGKGGISSDDPDAVQKLRDEINELEHQREERKAINAAWRKAGRPKPSDDDGWSQIAKALGKPVDDLVSIRKMMMVINASAGHSEPYPAYSLTNLGSNIRRIKARIEELEAASSRPSTESERAGVTIREDSEDNRIRLIFPGKPDEETRHLLKRHGFRWSPAAGAWQRHLNAQGRVAADLVLREIERRSSS